MNSIFRYLPVILFSTLFGKIIYQGNPTSWEAAILIGSGMIAFAHQYYNNNKEIKEVLSELNDIRTTIDRNKVVTDDKIKDTISSISSIKLGTNMTSRKLG